MSLLLEPREVVIKTMAGEDRTYILSKFPAIAGREIVSQYPISAVPKLGDYKTNEALMLKIMGFVAIPAENGELRLSTAALVDNHVPDYETLMKIEFHMMDYNTSFFSSGKVSTFLGNVEGKATAWISKTLTGLLEQSFLKDVPRSRN
ncbi:MULTISPECIES: hypothetical protein [Ralstonia solanacearum species complex]|uniref:hypothetical protein n=1 Tax=Ralstonia solanacearum species complex TaxID=3116862 RepID=UPI0018D05764|nr:MULTISPECIES: hypothetical protein [Ralstonia solanacearum species complex]